jgi:hypothetical protein
VVNKPGFCNQSRRTGRDGMIGSFSYSVLLVSNLWLQMCLPLRWALVLKRLVFYSNLNAATGLLMATLQLCVKIETEIPKTPDALRAQTVP